MKIQKHVRIDGRHFIVVFDTHGQAQIIKERIVQSKGEPWECLVDKSRWHFRHSSALTRPGLYARVIETAREQLQA